MSAVTATCLLAARSSVVAAVVLVVITIAELTLMVWAIVDLSQRRTVTWGNKWIWAVIIVLFGLVGPIVYFVAGRPQTPVGESSDEAARRSVGAAQRAGSAADLLYGPADESAANARTDRAAGESGAAPTEEDAGAASDDVSQPHDPAAGREQSPPHDGR